MSTALQLHPGLPIMTPQGEGIVMSVRHDGMVVTKLPVLAGGKGPGGAASFFIGFFHPSVVQVVSSGPSIVTTPSSPVGLFGHETPAPEMDVATDGRAASRMAVMVSPGHQPDAFEAVELRCSPPPSKRKRCSELHMGR